MSREQLGRLLKEDGFGSEDVARIERGELSLLAGVRRSLTIHLGVPEAWFTESLETVFRPPESRLARIEAKLDRLLPDQNGSSPPTLEESVDQVERAAKESRPSGEGHGSSGSAGASSSS